MDALRRLVVYPCSTQYRGCGNASGSRLELGTVTANGEEQRCPTASMPVPVPRAHISQDTGAKFPVDAGVSLAVGVVQLSAAQWLEGRDSPAEAAGKKRSGDGAGADRGSAQVRRLHAVSADPV